jgi:putative transposase
VPRVIVTDQLRGYHAAKEEIMPSVQHRQDKGQNNRAENSHQPTRAGGCDEAIRISRSGAAFSLSLRDHYLTLPSGETSVQS